MWGVSPESLRGWVKRDRIDRGEDTTGELTSAEREELRRLRKQNIEQQKTSDEHSDLWFCTTVGPHTAQVVPAYLDALLRAVGVGPGGLGACSDPAHSADVA